MDWAHIHLMISHFPVIGIVFGILLLSLAIIRKSKELKLVSFGIFIIIALVALAVYLTGEPAEEIVEKLPGVAESIIEQHEDMAFISLIAIEILGVIAAIGLFISLRSKSVSGWIVTALLVLSIVSGGLIGQIANLGGQIRHSEIRKDFQFPITDKEFGSEHERQEGKEYKHHERDEMKIYGTVERIPKGVFGTWIVRGREILVTKDTEIEEKYGRVKEGAYVEVEGNYSGKTIIASEIEVKREKRWN